MHPCPEISMYVKREHRDRMVATKIIFLFYTATIISVYAENKTRCFKDCHGKSKSNYKDGLLMEHCGCCGEAFVKILLSIDKSVGSFDPLEMNVFSHNFTLSDFSDNVLTTHNNSIGGFLDMNVTSAVCNETYMVINMTIPEFRLNGISNETSSWLNVTPTNNTVTISFNIEQSSPVQLSNIDVDFKFGDVNIKTNQKHSQQLVEKFLLKLDCKERMEKAPEDIFEDIIDEYFNTAFNEDSCEPNGKLHTENHIEVNKAED